MNAPRIPITPELLFPDMYLKAEDLGDRTATVTVGDIVVEKAQRIGGKKAKREKEAIMTFVGKKKRMMINNTNLWSMLLLLAPVGGRDINCVIGKRITIGVDMDRNPRDGQLGPCLRVIGSPDADPERTKMFNRAWHGDRSGGDLVARTKATMIRLGAVVTAKVDAPVGLPADVDAPTPGPEETFDEPWGDDDVKS